jgi:hypothetical protein
LQDGGAPVNGNYDFEWTIWADDAETYPISWSFAGAYHNIAVADGIFTLYLFPTGATMNETFDGAPRWITVYVRPSGTTTWTVLPVQPISPTPYAWSLYPGAIISGTATGHGLGEAIFSVSNDATWYPAILSQSSTASAVRGESPGGIGVNGYTDDGYAVFGSDGGTAESAGYGGYFTTNNGVGVYGRSFASSHYNNMYAPGVYGHSYYGTGVYGKTECTGWPCYGGFFEGSVGVRARSNGTSTDSGYAGSFVSENFRAVYANSMAGWYDAYFDGVFGIYSAGGYDSPAASRTVAVNGGDEPLEPGDVVAIVGVVESPAGGEPLLSVARAGAANRNAVVGVAVQALHAEMREVEGVGTSWDVQPVEGAVSPGGYVAIVTSGLVAEVRVEAGTRADGMAIGDWVTASSIPGAARRVDVTREGTVAVLGKVAGPVNVENGTVPVFITLR